MATAQTALPRRRQLIQALIKLENTLPALVWFFLVVFQLAKVYEEPWVSTIGLLLINSVAMILFLTRRDASRATLVTASHPAPNALERPSLLGVVAPGQ